MSGISCTNCLWSFFPGASAAPGGRKRGRVFRFGRDGWCLGVRDENLRLPRGRAPCFSPWRCQAGGAEWRRLWGPPSGAAVPSRSALPGAGAAAVPPRPALPRAEGGEGGRPAHVTGARPMARSRDAQRRLRARWGCARWRRAREGWRRLRRRDGGSRGPKGAGRGRRCRPRGAMVKWPRRGRRRSAPWTAASCWPRRSSLRTAGRWGRGRGAARGTAGGGGGPRAAWRCGGRPRTGRARSGAGSVGPRASGGRACVDRGALAAAAAPMAALGSPGRCPRGGCPRTPVSASGCFAPPVSSVRSSCGSGFRSRERVRPQALGPGHGGSLGPAEVSGAWPSPPSPSAAPVSGGCRGSAGRGWVRGCGRGRERGAPGQTEPARKGDGHQRLREKLCGSSRCFASS